MQNYGELEINCIPSNTSERTSLNKDCYWGFSKRRHTGYEGHDGDKTNYNRIELELSISKDCQEVAEAKVDNINNVSLPSSNPGQDHPMKAFPPPVTSTTLFFHCPVTFTLRLSVSNGV
ncbi:hypothetical protein ABVK25_002851 [Lepraria finkii]|uniref:Uncharacterized protein n=1 Tax=Lepraria finkii TaxID=1340010 RepID=A0ABR4BH08_9LECA